MARILVLGGFEYVAAARPIGKRASQRRLSALLAVLAVAGERGSTRDRLAAILWGETDDAHARHSLSDALYALRTELGADVVTADATMVRLGAGVTSDVGDFRAARQAGDRQAAVALYRGPLLDGFHVPGAPTFEEWLDVERGSLRRQYHDALEVLAHEAEVQGHLRDAVRWWEHLNSEDALNSRVAVALARAYTLAGDRGSAMRLLERHRTLLRDELGVNTGHNVRAVIEEVRNGAVTGPNGAASLQGPSEG